MPEPTAESEAPTVTEVCVAYIKHARQQYDRRDLNHIEQAIRLVRKLYGSEDAEGFGPKLLRVVRDRMIVTGLARTTVSTRVDWIRTIFKWAASHEICSARLYEKPQGLYRARLGSPGASQLTRGHVTMTMVSIGASLLVALTVVPALCRFLLNGRLGGEHGDGATLGVLQA